MDVNNHSDAWWWLIHLICYRLTQKSIIFIISFYLFAVAFAARTTSTYGDEKNEIWEKVKLVIFIHYNANGSRQ